MGRSSSGHLGVSLAGACSVACHVLVEFQKLEGRRLGKDANDIGTMRRIEQMEALAAKLDEMAVEITSVVRCELGVQQTD